MKNFKLNTLPQEIVSQIAAGEVVERPSSVVKELVDNSIDAGATEITIKVVNGGIDLIEISDNGTGIPKESLPDIFKGHTTTKISSLEDLNTLLTMGFRGEALSTIVSVAKVILKSKYVNSKTGAEIQFKSFDDYYIKSAARESGTVITVKNLFEDIPARKKFLKTPQTEYRRILKILYPYFLIYPNISFVLIKNSKESINLKAIPSSKEKTVVKERIEDVLKGDFVERMVKLYYNGSGIRISGLTAHPSDHKKRGTNQYLFVNGRPIWDNGIARALQQAYERYIPSGERVPFLIAIDIKPELIDVNVHPRKEEIRFLNPYRVYASVQEATKKALSSITSYHKESSGEEYITKSKSFFGKDISNKKYIKRDITFGNQSSGSVRDSLLFSREILSERENKKATIEQINTVKEGDIKKIFQIFNKYIVIELSQERVWVIDQHAAAERITFEKLSKSREQDIEKQQFLVPEKIHFSSDEILVMKELKEFFKILGFEYEIKEKTVDIKTVPVEFVESKLKNLFDEVLSLGESPKDLAQGFKRLKEDILATMSCHTSVRSGQRLHREEMLDILHNLMVCENPYSCPHGRPIVWKMTLSQIDSNFDRTY